MASNTADFSQLMASVTALERLNQKLKILLEFETFNKIAVEVPEAIKARNQLITALKSILTETAKAHNQLTATIGDGQDFDDFLTAIKPT